MNTNNSNYFLFILLITLLLSCSDNKVSVRRMKTNAQISIILDQLKTTEDSSLSANMPAYHLVYLQTSDDHTIGEVDKILFCDQKTIILDKKQKQLFIFDEKGNFSSKIDNIGKGPDQYIQINDFCVSEETKSIFATVVCGGRRIAVFEYGLNGVLKNRFYIPFTATKISAFNNFLVFYTDFGSDNRNDYNIYITTKEGKIVSKQFPYKTRNGGWTIDYNVFLRDKNQLFYYPVYGDTIYRFIDQNNTEPYIIIKENELSNSQKLSDRYRDISMEEFIKFEQESNMRIFSNITITENHIFFNSHSQDIDENYIYDIKNNKLILSKGRDYLSLITASPLATDGDSLVNIIYPYEIHNFVNNVKNRISANSFNIFMIENAYIKTIYEHTTPVDNPIIIKYKL